MSYHILIIDDEQVQCRAMQLVVENMLRYEATTISDSRKALDLLLSDKGDEFDVVLLDLSMPDIDGMEILRAVKPVHPQLPIIINTAHGDITKAVDALKLGAVDFVEKQDGDARLKVAIENATRICRLEKEVSRLERQNSGQTMFKDIIGKSDEIKKVRTLATRAADSDISVLIKGESGVGKELFARAIHGSSSRSEKPFVAVNCGAIPENLVESTLFGHEKGSFTGAISKQLGKFREASGGTLFLDEIGELKPDVQVRLLRAIQEGEIEPVGATKPERVDIRLISATHVNLEKAVSKGDFREDLYYRINVFPMIVPPLRKRSDDIAGLANHFAKKISDREGFNFEPLTDEIIELLEEYNWPGNIRQLENSLFRAIVMNNGGVLSRDYFMHLKNSLGIADEIGNVGKYVEDEHYDNSLSLLNDEGSFRDISSIEAEIIEVALNIRGWRISKVARELGIGRSTLYRKMQEYNIQNPNQSDVA